MDNYQEIGARLRELREVSDYSIEELAVELGLSPEVYASYEENGNKDKRERYLSLLKARK